MHYKTPLLLLSLASSVFAQEFDNNDVPSQCRSVCQSMVDAARTCDQNFDGDRQEVDCICNTQGASTQLPECAACVRQFDPDRDGDNDNDQDDIDEVMSSCGFTSTTFNAGAAGATGGAGSITSSSARSMITSVYTTTSTDFDDDPDDQDETSTFTRTTVFPADSTPTNAAGSASQGAGSATSNAGSAVGSATSAAGSAVDSATSAAGGGDDASGAAATALPMLGAGAGALIVAIGLL